MLTTWKIKDILYRVKHYENKESLRKSFHFEGQLSLHHFLFSVRLKNLKHKTKIKLNESKKKMDKSIKKIENKKWIKFKKLNKT